MSAQFSEQTIYLDHAATTPVAPEVLAAMEPWFTRNYGNPSSIYAAGQEAHAALDRARFAAARVLGCQAGEVIFTGGATESDALALQGVAWGARLANPGGPARHIITTAIEHSAILQTAAFLEEQGFTVTRVPCTPEGLIRLEDVAAAIRPETCLISVMYANNEIGTVQPIAEIARLAHDRSIPVHTDAVQAAGLLSLNVDELGVDLLSLSAHKFYGPKGVGVLYVRKGTKMRFLQQGGGQESGRRGGTENVAGVVGLATALSKADAIRDEYAVQCRALRDRLYAGISAGIDGVEINGVYDSEQRLASNLNLFIPGIQGETILLNLDMEGVAASAGSACTAGKSEPSHVLEALGFPEERTRSSIRLTVGRTNDEAQIDEAVEIIVGAVERIRELGG